MLYEKKEPKIKYQQFPEAEYFPHRHPGFGTKAIHAGQDPEPVHGSVNVPVHLSSTFAQKDIAQPFGQFDYSRCGNPTRLALEECLTALEYGNSAIAFSSGCGATATLLHTLKQGDHVIVCDDVYGGTNRYMRRYFTDKHGMQAEFVDITEVKNVTKAIKKETRMIWIETPTNPTLKIIDIEVVVKEVRAADPSIKIIVDNTFASPYITSPLLLGADVAYHSITKYIGGHSDLVMGALVFRDNDFMKVAHMAAMSIGVNPGPFDCYLALRGVKTLELRVIQGTKSAYHLAHYLEKSPHVDSVIYPGLKTNQYHEVAKKQMRGFGGMISFRVKGGQAQASKFLKACRVFTLAESLGGVESLAQVPALMTHASVSAEERAVLGITDNLIRLSLGVEDTDDLIFDVEQALEISQK